MSGKRSRDKGNRLERLVVNALRAAGQQAERVPLSGSCQGSFGDDIQWKLATQTLNLECKARAHGFSFLYDNLKPSVPLIIKADSKEPLFVCTLSQAIELIGNRNISAQVNTIESPKVDASSNSFQNGYKAIASHGLGFYLKLSQAALSSCEPSRGD